MFSKQLLFGATLAASAVAQTTTIDALLSPDNTASVVQADCSSTVLAVGCAGSDNEYCQQAAQYGASTVTLTVKPTAVWLNFATSSAGVAAGLDFSCDYLGPSPSFTSQSCSLSLSVSGSGISTSIDTVIDQSVTVTPEAVTVTAGADKLTCGGGASTTGASSTGTSSTGSGTAAANTGASSTSSKGAAAAATAVPVIYKVLVPVGAAFAAGAAYL